MTISKIIIQTWKTKKLPPNFAKWSLTWKTMNQDFTWMFFDDNDCYRLISKDYPEYLNLYESLSTIEKADVFRYLALHKYGGVYADVDTECLKEIGPLLELFNNSVITGIEYEKNDKNSAQYLQWFIAAPKGSPVMIELVNEVYKRSWFKPFKMFMLTSNELVYWFTGPVMFTYVLQNSKESIVVMEKGRLGCYDQRLIDRNSYLQHWFCSTWKEKSVSLDNSKIQ